MLAKFRKYLRARTLFMDPHHAAYTKNRLALTYTFICWNLFGLVIYALAKEKLPEAKDSRDFAKLYGVKDATVMKISGFNIVEEFDVKYSEEDLKEFTTVIGTDEEKKLYNEKSAQKKKEEDEARKALINT